MPYLQFESVGDFIPESMCSKFTVGLQMRGRKMGGIRGPVRLRTEGPRVTGAPTCAKCLSVCSIGIFRRLFDSSESIVVCSDCLSFGESASPFIDEGDGFTRESVRERVCVLPSLVAHTVGYKAV